VLRVEELKAGLPVGKLGVELHFYPSLSSTNDRAAELARAGAPEGTLVVADEQTAGRGRSGRRWHSLAGSGLALSLVLRPTTLGSREIAALGMIGALGSIEALAELGLQPQLKWPNDVLLDGAKVGGILAEASWTASQLDHVILGIGLNVRNTPLPEVDFPATAVEQSLGKPVAREALLLRVLAATDRWYGRLIEGTAHPDWEARLAYRGKRVALSNGKGEQVGVVLGLTSQAGIRMAIEGDEQVVFESGAYRLRPL
jgi:BirA family biotin operon repressor/biotin-[acetyl-CoA-carboxylase] ligase